MSFITGTVGTSLEGARVQVTISSPLILVTPPALVLVDRQRHGGGDLGVGQTWPKSQPYLAALGKTVIFARLTFCPWYMWHRTLVTYANIFPAPTAGLPLRSKHTNSWSRQLCFPASSADLCAVTAVGTIWPRSLAKERVAGLGGTSRCLLTQLDRYSFPFLSLLHEVRAGGSS